jgi:hypothetical protein
LAVLCNPFSDFGINMALSLALREWSAVVEALGQGQQTVMVRSYPPRYGAFFLYPTFSFYTSTKAKPESFDEKFQPQYRKMARQSAELTAKRAGNLLVDFNYYAEIDEVVAIQNGITWERLKPYFIWSVDHIKHYATSSTFLWIVRIHQLPKTVVIGRSAGGGPPTFYKHADEISTDGSTPVLSDAQYGKLKAEIIKLTPLSLAQSHGS